MSRGLGRRQLGALDWLRQFPNGTVIEIAEVVLRKPDVTKNELRTFRRAIQGLEKRKLIKLGGLNNRGQECWVITSRARLVAQKPPKAPQKPTLVK